MRAGDGIGFVWDRTQYPQAHTGARTKGRLDLARQQHLLVCVRARASQVAAPIGTCVGRQGARLSLNLHQRKV